VHSCSVTFVATGMAVLCFIQELVCALPYCFGHVVAFAVNWVSILTTTTKRLQCSPNSTVWIWKYLHLVTAGQPVHTMEHYYWWREQTSFLWTNVIP
jgi:hypothetical protein